MEGRPGKARACFFIDYCDEGVPTKNSVFVYYEKFRFIILSIIQQVLRKMNA